MIHYDPIAPLGIALIGNGVRCIKNLKITQLDYKKDITAAKAWNLPVEDNETMHSIDSWDPNIHLVVLLLDC